MRYKFSNFQNMYPIDCRPINRLLSGGGVCELVPHIPSTCADYPNLANPMDLYKNSERFEKI